jgi:hypothetical protein
MMTKEIMVKMVLDAWYAKVKESDEIFDKLTDAQLQTEVAPGRNRGIYLLGHLAATHDALLPLLGFGDRSYSQLDEIYIMHPDRSVTEVNSAQELRAYWKSINETLADHFSKQSPDVWFEKHNAVSEQDFTKQPHRNKLNVIITRTTHLSYHNGQLIFLVK